MGIPLFLPPRLPPSISLLVTQSMDRNWTSLHWKGENGLKAKWRRKRLGNITRKRRGQWMSYSLMRSSDGFNEKDWLQPRRSCRTQEHWSDEPRTQPFLRPQRKTTNENKKEEEERHSESSIVLLCAIPFLIVQSCHYFFQSREKVNESERRREDGKAEEKEVTCKQTGIRLSLGG